ncbi:hypothetical protein Ddc_15590 [Ditylenchus destructor]|nr:hypothetical protein Ddc_15590 [Ditylenchus destructor]
MVRELRPFDNLRRKLEHEQAQWPDANITEMNDADSGFHEDGQLNPDKRRKFSTIDSGKNYSDSSKKIPTVKSENNSNKKYGSAIRRAASEQRIALRPPASVKQSPGLSSHSSALDEDIYQIGPSVDSANVVNASGAILLQDPVKNFINQGIQTDLMLQHNGIFSGTSSININVNNLISDEAMNKFIDVFEKVANGIVSNLSAASKKTEKDY